MKFKKPICKSEKITRIAKTTKVAGPKAKTTTKATKKKITIPKVTNRKKAAAANK